MSENNPDIKQALVLNDDETDLLYLNTPEDQAKSQIKLLQKLSLEPFGTTLRRALLVWMRIYVYERDDEKKVNLRIPIPFPILGAFLPRQISTRRALALRSTLLQTDNPAKAMEIELESMMGFEFVRVEEEDKVVVLGFD
jgi:hypothetical protein